MLLTRVACFVSGSKVPGTLFGHSKSSSLGVWWVCTHFTSTQVTPLQVVHNQFTCSLLSNSTDAKGQWNVLTPNSWHAEHSIYIHTYIRSSQVMRGKIKKKLKRTLDFSVCNVNLTVYQRFIVVIFSGFFFLNGKLWFPNHYGRPSIRSTIGLPYPKHNS